MSFPALEKYLARLHDAAPANTRVWLDAQGRGQGRYFNSTLTSAFQPIRRLDTGTIVGYEGFARSYSASGEGLSIWKLLDQAADDDESVELDRLCRMLHAINFFRQAASAHADLFLSVHARLLIAVDGNHGIAFRRILQALDLPQHKIVLQLPAVGEQQYWLLGYVADNYRRNGFRIAINAADATEAIALLERIRPDIVKVDARESIDSIATAKLLAICDRQNIQALFKRVENSKTIDSLRQLDSNGELIIHAQGYFWGMPNAALDWAAATTIANMTSTIP